MPSRAQPRPACLAPARIPARATRAIVALALSLSLSGLASAQCLQWSNRNISMPRPNSMPPSWGWSPTIMTTVYDSHRHVTVAIGGYGSSPTNHDQALFYLPVNEYNGTQWVSRYDGSAANTPPFRHIGGAAFDSARNVTLIYGGWIGNLTFAQRELWEYDGTTWAKRTPVGPAPAATIYAPMAFDPLHHRTIVLVQHPTLGGYFQTWEWDGAIWTQGPNMGPTDVGIAQMVFDTARNKAFVYSGQLNGDREEAWEYTTAATAAQGTWQKLTISGDSFPRYSGVSLVYDLHRQRIYRQGGHGTSLFSYIDGTYEWDTNLQRWTVLTAIGGNNGRAGSAIAFDSDRDLTVLYGGIKYFQDGSGTGNTTTYTDTWEFSRALPGFTNIPSNATVDGGQNAVFAATVIGDGVTLQWLRNGALVPGATGPILAITGASQANAGAYQLRATNTCGYIDTPPATLTVRPPANDSAFTPSVIYAPTILSTTLGATADGVTTCGTSNASPDVWFRYVVPYTGSMTIDTCGSSFDTVLSFHAPTAATTYACSDDNPLAGCGGTTSSLAAPVTQGQVFLVRVSGYQGAAGNFTLNTRVVPFNNACASATPVFAGTYDGNTVGATADGAASCGTSNTTPDIWYRFRSGCSGTMTLDTSGSSFDTVLSVRRSLCNGVEDACNDDVQLGTLWSYVSFTVASNVDYYIRVSGFNGATGTVILHVSPPPVAEDACAGAIPVGLGDTTYNTRCATSTPMPLPPWCEGAAGAVPFYDTWYRYTATAPGNLEVRLCNLTFNTALAVYGSCPTSSYDALICAARGDSCGSTPLASIPTLPGDQYLLRLGGYYGLNAGLAGAGTLELTLVPFETGACCLNIGGCSLTSAYECAGAFRGEGSVCAPSPCPSQAGSCCTGTHCTMLESAACESAGGSFGGTGTSCLQSPTNPTTCCRANFNGADGLSVQDIFDFLNAWFAADPRADFDGLNGLDIPDIFALLNAWFAGCS